MPRDLVKKEVGSLLIRDGLDLTVLRDLLLNIITILMLEMYERRS